MAYYLYTPESSAGPETIGLEGGSWTDVESERHKLVNQAMNAALRREGESSVAVELHRADHERLPIGFVSRLINPDYYDTQIMEAGTGLAMYAPTDIEEGSPHFALLLDEIDDPESLLEMGEDGLDPDTFEHLGRKDELTHSALQFEPVRHDGTVNLRAHNSFGYIGTGGSYQPVVTVLSPDHPIRQAIEQARQEG